MGLEFRWGAGRIERYFRVRGAQSLQTSNATLGLAYNMDEPGWWNPVRWNWQTRLLATAIVAGGAVAIVSSNRGGTGCEGGKLIPSKDTCEEFPLRDGCEPIFDVLRQQSVDSFECVGVGGSGGD